MFKDELVNKFLNTLKSCSFDSITSVSHSQLKPCAMLTSKSVFPTKALSVMNRVEQWLILKVFSSKSVDMAQHLMVGVQIYQISSPGPTQDRRKVSQPEFKPFHLSPEFLASGRQTFSIQFIFEHFFHV